MFKASLLLTVAGALTVCLPQVGISEEPHEVWLKAVEGTWTWKDEVRGEVTLTFKSDAQGRCLVGRGKDDTGTFVVIVGWEPAIKALTDTGFHSNGGGSRIIYDQVTATTLKGVNRGAGPGGVPRPESKVHVVRDGNKITVTATDPEGKTTTTEMTKLIK